MQRCFNNCPGSLSMFCAMISLDYQISNGFLFMLPPRDASVACVDRLQLGSGSSVSQKHKYSSIVNSLPMEKKSGMFDSKLSVSLNR